MRPIRAAFVGFGEVNTPRELIDRRVEEAARSLTAAGIDLVCTAPVRDDPAGQDVARARKELQAAGAFDVLILCVAGWIPSHAVIDVIEPFRHTPMVLWGLSGWREGDRWVTTADQAGTTALRKPMQDMGYTFAYVPTLRGQPPRTAEVVAYANAARTAAMLRGARIGMMGYRDMRLFGTLHDGVSLRAKIGPDIETFEMLEMVQAMDKLSADEVAKVAQDIRRRWTFVKEPRPGTVENAVRLYLAIRQKVQARRYEGISLIDVDGVKKLLGFAPAGVFMMLAENENICTVPENDCMGAVTQLMVHYLTDQAAAYMEFYDFLEDGVLMGVPDYVPKGVVDGPVTVMPTAFGEFGEGLLNVSKVRTGPVTLARLTYAGDRYAMHIVNGTAQTPAKWEEAGWTPPAPQLPSLEIRLNGPVDAFAQKVLSQHYIIAHGDHRRELEYLCGILGVSLM